MPRDATGHLNATWTLASLKIPLTGVLADWSKADMKTFEAPLIGYEQGVDFFMLIVTSNSSKSPS